MRVSSSLFLFLALSACLLARLSAHDGHPHTHTQGGEQGHANPNVEWLKLIVESTGSNPSWIFTSIVQVGAANDDKPVLARHFEKFANVKVRWDRKSLFVESNGLPEHNMMIGIKSWQQQVPLPQPFTGSNAWTIPRYPKLAEKPISVREKPLRGAIAIAVNGVPIFCALNNRGEDAYLLGELDEWGGHCGRGDDYHYHIAPVHLEEVVGKGQPIAYALDGYPIYGFTEADGSSVGALDEYNGQFDSDGNYHYHATQSFPYVNGGLRGVVTMDGDQVKQPRDSPVRPGQPPLRGARIVDFKTSGNKSVLTYQVQQNKGTITYTPTGENGWVFTYAEPSGRTRTETYQRRQGGARPGGGDPRRPPPRNQRPRRP